MSDQFTVIQGDAIDALLNKDIDYLLHVCNAKGVMGSGIALSIKNRIPAAYAAYKKCYQDTDGNILGEISSGGFVVNLCAQADYGYDGKRYLNYEALATCLEAVSVCLKSHPSSTKIGVPYLMGCDRAGGDWSIVSAMLKHYLKGYEVIVYKLK